MSRTSPATGSAASPWHRLLKCKPLLWVVLPLGLLVGCASAPTPSTVAYNSTFAVVPNAAPVSSREAANWALAHEIFHLFMTDTNIDYILTASNDRGVVRLSRTSSNEVEEQRLVNAMWDLAGVSDVKDKLGVDVARTVPAKAIAVR